MNKSSVDIERQLSIMSEYSLDAEEYMFIQLVFLAVEPNPHPQYLYKYFRECKKATPTREMILSLKDKKILSKNYSVPEKGEIFRIEDLEFDKTFINKYFKESFEGGEELFNLYPDYLQNASNGNLYPAKNITKGGFMSLEDFFFAYSKAIRHSRANHEKVMDILNWSIQNKLITYGIVEYVVTRKWNDHIRMRELDQVGGFNVKMDTLEDL